MRTTEQLCLELYRALAWVTKYQQKLPTIREDRLPTHEEQRELYGNIVFAQLAINAICWAALDNQKSSEIVDALAARDMLINPDEGRRYVEKKYSISDNNYVIFKQIMEFCKPFQQQGGICLDATVENSDASYVVSVLSGGLLILPDVDIEVVDALNNVLDTQTVPSITNQTVNVTSYCNPATVELNGSAFGTVPSGGSVDVLLRDQDGNVIVPDSLAFPQVNVTLDKSTLIRFVFNVGETETETYTIVAGVNDGTYTAATNDGGSGTIEFSINGGAFAAFVNPTTLAANDTIKVTRTSTASAGFVQITGVHP